MLKKHRLERSLAAPSIEPASVPAAGEVKVVRAKAVVHIYDVDADADPYPDIDPYVVDPE